MKKFLRIPLAVSILCMSVGCGGDSTENPDPSTDPPTPPVTEDTIAFTDEVPPAPLFPEKGGEQTLSFTSAAAWTARVSDPIPAAGAGDATRAAADWLSVSPRSGAAGAATIRVVALPNDTDSDRTGIVTLQAGTASQLLTVTQLRRGALVAATESITVDNAGGEVPIVVSSNVEFDITIDGDWITQVETRALTRDTLRFRIDENRGYDNRMGTITFSSKDKTIEQEVKIYQAQQDALIVSPTDWLFDEKIWTFEIEVRANVEFTVENPDVVWLRPVETRGLKTHTLRYRVDENTTYDSRSAEICIVDTKRNLSQTVTVTQSQKDALVVAESSYTMPQEGGEITVEVTRNVPFDITIGAGWITQVETRGLITEHLRFRIAENPGDENREGVIVFESKDHEIRQEVKIYQAQKDALVVSPTDNVFDEKGQTFEIEVRTNVEFTVENPDVVWLRPVETRGLKTHTLRYRLDENTTYDSRSAEIRIVDTKRNISQVVTVTQTQKDALVVAQSSYTLPQEGGEIAVDVTRNVPIDITIGAGWITQVETRGLVTEYLRFRIAENPGDKHREGVIVFESKDHEIRQEVRIVQEGLNAVEEAKVRAYLIKFYNDTDGPHWSNRTNWCSNKPINEWYGVTYSKGELKLRFSGNNLKGNIDLSGCMALADLYCTYNQLTSLDVSGCTALADLYCTYNQLTSLNVSGCTALAHFICDSRQLISLDVSGCTALTSLNCDNSQLTDLDVSSCASLTELWCNNSQLTSLNVSGCTVLTELRCYENQLTSLNVSGCAALTTLDCCNNQLTTLVVSGCTALEWVNCSWNQLTSLTFSGCSELSTLWCYRNQLTGLNISDCKKITYLYCQDNQLVSLDISGCSALIDLCCERNQLTSLNISGCSALTIYLLRYSHNPPMSLNASGCTSLETIFSNNPLTRLDVSGCTNMSSLDCRNNQLTRLDISGCSALRALWCYSNQLTGLDASDCTELTILDCNSNQLSSLNVSNCPLLTELNCANNQLTELDVSACVNLPGLSCSNNLLSTLNVSGCTALTSLDCSNNLLKSLNVSDCIALRELRCKNNQLTDLDFSGSKVLYLLSCSDNQLTSLNISGCTALGMLNCANNQLTYITGLSECASMLSCKTINNKICQEIPSSFNNLLIYLNEPGWDNYLWIDGYRYEYYPVWNEASGKYVTHYRDKGVGWWYPGEPGKGYHGW